MHCTIHTNPSKWKKKEEKLGSTSIDAMGNKPYWCDKICVIPALWVIHFACMLGHNLSAFSADLTENTNNPNGFYWFFLYTAFFHPTSFLVRWMDLKSSALKLIFLLFLIPTLCFCMFLLLSQHTHVCCFAHVKSETCKSHFTHNAVQIAASHREFWSVLTLGTVHLHTKKWRFVFHVMCRDWAAHGNTLRLGVSSEGHSTSCSQRHFVSRAGGFNCSDCQVSCSTCVVIYAKFVKIFGTVYSNFNGHLLVEFHILFVMTERCMYTHVQHVRVNIGVSFFFFLTISSQLQL